MNFNWVFFFPQVGALEGDEELTPLGHHLAKLPVDVLIGKVCTKYSLTRVPSHFLDALLIFAYHFSLLACPFAAPYTAFL